MAEQEAAVQQWLETPAIQREHKERGGGKQHSKERAIISGDHDGAERKSGGHQADVAPCTCRVESFARVESICQRDPK